MIKSYILKGTDKISIVVTMYNVVNQPILHNPVSDSCR